MKRLILLFFAFFLQSLAFSQHHGIDKYEVDTLQFYDPEENTYTFYLDSKSQGLFVDQIKVVWLPEIRVRIINNTGKTIENDFRERDAHLMWYRSKWNKILKPGEEMILVSKWLVSRHQPKVWLNRNIDFNYQIDSVSHRFSIKTWGEFHVDVEEQQIISDKKKAELAEAERQRQEKKQTNPPKMKIVDEQPSTKIRLRDSIQVVKKKSYYKGEEVNKMTRKGFRKGKWITLYDNNYVKSIEFYSGKDFHWDSAYFCYETTRRYERKMYHVKLSDSAVMKREFNDQGTPTKTYLWNGEIILEPKYRFFYKTGELRAEEYPYPNKHRMDYYQSGNKQKYTSYNMEGKIDTILNYHPDGYLRSLELMNNHGKITRRYTYDSDGDLLFDENLRWRSTTSYKYLSKTDSMYIVERYFKGKHSWTDTGTYRNNDLWTGRRVSTQGGIYSLPKVFIEGNQNGLIYEGEWVNRSESRRRVGRWLTFYYPSGVIRQDMYFGKNGIDSSFSYYESGALREVNYSRAFLSEFEKSKVTYYEGGSVQFESGGFRGDTVWVKYWTSGDIQEVKRSNGYVYHFKQNESCFYKIVRRNIWIDKIPREERYFDPNFPVREYSPTEDYYKNCKMYKRISSRSCAVDGIEGKQWRRIPYRIEKGTFKDDKLSQGVREYYDAKENLLRSVRVINGEEKK